MPDNPTEGQIYIDDEGTMWQFNNGNWRGGIKAVDIWGEGRGGSGGGMIGNCGNIYFQEMMARHNEMLAYMDARSNARWEAMQAQLRLEEALRRAEVAKDHRDAMAARQKAQALKQGIQEMARNGLVSTTIRKSHEFFNRSTNAPPGQTHLKCFLVS